MRGVNKVMIIGHLGADQMFISLLMAIVSLTFLSLRQISGQMQMVNLKNQQNGTKLSYSIA